MGPYCNYVLSSAMRVSWIMMSPGGTSSLILSLSLDSVNMTKACMPQDECYRPSIDEFDEASNGQDYVSHYWGHLYQTGVLNFQVGVLRSALYINILL